MEPAIKTKQYIKLPQISNQKIRQKYYSSASTTHPAKAQIPMMHWILKKFVKDGDIVLDPMAGIFTTGIEGLRLFPNSLFIGIELESKFVQMARDNIKKVEAIAKKDMFLKIGRAVVVQGDARELEKIMKEEVSKIITSPPYSGVEAHHDLKFMKESAQDFTEKVKKGKIKGHGFTAEARKRVFEKAEKGKSENPENIGNLQYGQADKIISSPPFGGKVQHKTNYLGRQKRESGFEYSNDPENIGNIPHGKIDKVISSPPYQHGGSVYEGMIQKVEKAFREGKITKEQYNHFKGRKAYNGNAAKPYVDKVISSPPYSKDVEPHTEMRPGAEKKTSRGYVDKVISSPPYQEGIGHGGKRKKKAVERSKGLWAQGRDSYSKSKNNIGSLTGKTYLNQMLLVYQQCFEILKADGLMILITKDFIREKKRVRLGEDTVKLCQVAGFIFKEIYYRKIEHPSFWRILYQQKYPSVEKIDSEDILVFKKP